MKGRKSNNEDTYLLHNLSFDEDFTRKKKSNFIKKCNPKFFVIQILHIFSFDRCLSDGGENKKKYNLFLFFLGFFVIAVLFFIFLRFYLVKSVFYFASKDTLYNKDSYFIKNNLFYLQKLEANSDEQIFFGKSRIELKENDNLFYALIREGFDRENVNDVISLIDTNINLKALSVGQKFDIEYSYKVDYALDKYYNHHIKKGSLYIFPKKYTIVEKREILKVYFKDNNSLLRYTLTKSKHHYYELKVEKPTLFKRRRIFSGTIKNSLFSDVLPYGIKASTLYNVLNEYAFLIDFQRDIHKNDKFCFLVDVQLDQDGETISERILYFNLILNGKKYEIFNFNGKFYDRKGDSVKKALLKTPIDGARISSRFNLHRKHPILGYTKAHLGVDLSAPTGTPIYSAGDGVIVAKNRTESYGKYIDIRHNKEFTTRYAHMSRFANLKVGDRVSQRQIIGYVGMTGLATGPHLHYEVIRNGKHINPSSINVSSVKHIKNNELNEFRQIVKNIDNELSKHK